MSDDYDPLAGDYDDGEETLEIEEDAGDGDADEGEGDLAGGEEGEIGQTAARQGQSHDQVGRKPASETIRELRERARRAEEKAALAERLALTARPSTQAQTESAAARAERLAMMDPEERLRYELQETTGSLRNELASIRFEAQESADRTAFEAECARNPVAAKLKDQVEERLREMRASGTTAPRATILRYVLGDRMLANAGRAKGKAQRTAEGNIARQTARPGSARGDAIADSRRGGADSAAARAKRLDGVQI